MLPFAHIGIGSFAAKRWNEKLPWQTLALGTILPDLIDKPIYYGLVILKKAHGAELGLFSGTRTIGHSLALFIVLGLLAAMQKSRVLLALWIGVATHLLLDNFAEPFSDLTIYSSRIALFFPIYGWTFPITPHHNVKEHLYFHFNTIDLAGECIGLALIFFMYWKSRKQLK